MDEKHFERAERIEQWARDDGLSAAARATRPETHPDFDGTHCVECGDEIPAGRLALGRVRCVVCQAEKERRR